MFLFSFLVVNAEFNNFDITSHLKSVIHIFYISNYRTVNNFLTILMDFHGQCHVFFF